ncbi:MAG: DUF4926 domain-containing protein [Chitinophagaceae bacterium]
MAKFELYSDVQLAKDLPDKGFIKGDVATIVDILPSPSGKTGYCLEFFDKKGNTLDVTIVDEDDIHYPFEHAVVHYRQLSH